VVHALDFSGPSTYFDGVEWVRNNVVLRNAIGQPVLQLDVTISPGVVVTLYMDPQTHYIMGFKGADRIYLMYDPLCGQFKDSLKTTYKDSNPEILDGLRSSHGSDGLETLERNRHGYPGVFARSDLDTAKWLNEYQRGRKPTYDHLRLPLSLLVCMIAEAARFPMMQRDFTNMYFGHSVAADAAIQSYADAGFLRDIAIETFPEATLMPGVAIEKLQKRIDGINLLLARIRLVRKDAPSDNKGLIEDLFRRKQTAWTGPTAAQDEELYRMFQQLKWTEARKIAEIIKAFENADAVRAVRQGVAIIKIGL
jgi:hypothetical protein